MKTYTIQLDETVAEILESIAKSLNKNIEVVIQDGISNLVETVEKTFSTIEN